MVHVGEVHRGGLLNNPWAVRDNTPANAVAQGAPRALVAPAKNHERNSLSVVGQ